MLDIVFLLLGLGVLIAGGEFLVKGAVGFSHAMKISPLVIGMTVVAFGTSAPELLVSVDSALSGSPGIAVGNVVGSNIANLALVLGVTVMIFPIYAERQTKMIDYPMMILATLLFYNFSLDGVFDFSEGLILFTILLVYTTVMIYSSRRKNKRKHDHHKKNNDEDELDEIVKKDPFWKSMFFLLLGFIGLYFGAGWFVDGAVGIADIILANHPDKEVIIGVTVVALGTSAPELVASIMAALKKETDISVGNLIGSNIFNIFGVVGVTSMVTPVPVSNEIIEFDMLWVILVALLLLFVLFFGNRIGRLKGAILLSTYIAYISVILLKVQGVI